MEQEIKLRFQDESAFGRFMQSSHKEAWLPEEKCHVTAMQSRYWDTPDGLLRQRRIALRYRRENQRRVVAIKQDVAVDSSLHRRQEWEAESDSIEAAATLAGSKVATLFAKQAREDKDLAQVLSLLQGQKLCQIASIEFERLWAIACHDGCRAQIAVDRGTFQCAGKTRPFQELEIESLGGSLVPWLSLADTLCQAFDLLPERDSKLVQCLKLGVKEGKGCQT